MSLIYKADNEDELCPDCGGTGVITYDDIGRVGMDYDIIGYTVECPNPNCKGQVLCRI